MRIGVLGGTFDPVHWGHLIMAETCREELSLDQVRLIPAAIPPHKQDREISSGKARAEMLELAVSGYPEFVVDRRELARTGPSFTIRTLEELRQELPDGELFFLMGADSLRDLMTWKDPDHIAELCTLVVCNRPGCPLPELSQVQSWVSPGISRKVTFVRMPGTDISATELRARFKSRRSVRFLLPRAVEAYVHQHNLYFG